MKWFLVAVGVLSCALVACGDDGAEETRTLGNARLVVADSDAKKVMVTDGDTILLQLDDVQMNDHAGFIAGEDGRVLFIDENAGALVVLKPLTDPPAVIERVTIPVPAVHLAVDSGFRYAVTSAYVDGDDASARITVVDLASYAVSTVTVASGEAGILVGSEPPVVYVRDGSEAGKINAHAVSDLLAGETAPAATVTIGAYPHGDVIAHREGMLFVASDAGLERVSFSGTSFGTVSSVPWDASGRTGGRAYFARLSAAGDQLFSYIRNDFYPEERPWTQWENDIYAYDIASGAATRIPVGGGLVYRCAVGEGVALYAHMSPAGDSALIVDAQPGSATRNRVVATIALPAMSEAAGENDSPWETPAFRITALTPDGKTGFVSAGADGQVHIIDVAKRNIKKTLTLPTALRFGGYLIAVQPSAELVDTVGR